MKKKILFFLFTFFLLSFFVCLFPKLVLAAKFNLEPSSLGIKVNGEFQVNVNLDTQGKKVNGVQAKILFTQELLEIVGVNFSGIFPANFQSIDNPNGEIQIGSGEDLPTASFNSNSTWVTLTLKAKNQGASELKFSCPDSAILELETTNNLLDCGSLSLGSYTIGGEDQPAPSPSPETGVTCTDSPPETPTNLTVASGPEAGQVALTWVKSPIADYYGLVFGSGSKSYQYGAANIGNTNQYVVRQLTPGELYYFAVFAVRSCATSGFSNEVSARARAVETGGTVPSEPASAIYQPVEQVFSGVAFPSPSPLLEPSPASVVEPEKEPTRLSWKEILIFGLPLLILFIFLVTLGAFIWRRRSKPPLPPESGPPFSEEAPRLPMQPLG